MLASKKKRSGCYERLCRAINIWGQCIRLNRNKERLNRFEDYAKDKVIKLEDFRLIWF